MPMCDAQCEKCKKRFGWQGEPRDRPPCPRCGFSPPAELLEADQANIDQMFKLLKTHPRDADGPTLVEMRKLAGLGRRQAARALGLDHIVLIRYENSIWQLPPEVADKMATLYGCGALKDSSV